MDWQVECKNCGNFTAVGRSEPVLCPQCGLPDIDTSPLDGEREQVQQPCETCRLPKRMKRSTEKQFVCGNRRCARFGIAN